MKTINTLPIIDLTSLLKEKDNTNSALLTSPTVKKKYQKYFKNLNIKKIIYISSIDDKNIKKLLKKPHGINKIYAIGAGAVMDVGRYIASIWDLSIICVPTIISSDAFLVDCTAVRKDNCVKYIPSKKADKVILDLEILKKDFKNIYGCSDVLSIYTGLWDWKYANKMNKVKKDEIYNPSIAKIAKGILEALLLDADNIKSNNSNGIATIVSCLAMEVALCNYYGNSRPEEGGEHFFTYYIENYLPHFLHGNMVAFGILLTAFLQKQDWKKIKEFMDFTGLDYTVQGLNKKLIIKALKEMPNYVRKNKLRYSIYNTYRYDKNDIALINFLDFLLLK